MNAVAIKVVAEGAVFVVDTLGYSSKITPLDLGLAMQTISFTDWGQGQAMEPLLLEDVTVGWP